MNYLNDLIVKMWKHIVMSKDLSKDEIAEIESVLKDLYENRLSKRSALMQEEIYFIISAFTVKITLLVEDYAEHGIKGPYERGKFMDFEKEVYHPALRFYKELNHAYRRYRSTLYGGEYVSDAKKEEDANQLKQGLKEINKYYKDTVQWLKKAKR